MQDGKKTPLWLEKERQEAIDKGKQGQLTREQYDKINEALIRATPELGRIDERVIYDKEFLLEIQSKGYNPLDKEDVKNYLEQKPPKDLERNLKLCGVGKHDLMGQSEYSEDDLKDFLGKSKTKISIKKPEDVYLSDIPAKKQKDFLLEEKPFFHGLENSDKYEKWKDHKESEDDFRSNLAKALGADDMKIRSEDYNLFESKSTDIVKSDGKTEKMLELIKELRALGFSAEEIRKEIQRMH